VTVQQAFSNRRHFRERVPDPTDPYGADDPKQGSVSGDPYEVGYDPDTERGAVDEESPG
jgi:hypothetical protein